MMYDFWPVLFHSKDDRNPPQIRDDDTNFSNKVVVCERVFYSDVTLCAQ